MNCARCNIENDARRRFCRDCGAPLVITCERCSFVNGVRDRFCGGCGDALGAAKAASVGAPRTSSVASARSSAPETKTVRPGTTAAKPAGGVISESELESLVTPAPPVEASPLPSKFSQEDLDKLFGSAS